MNVTILSPRDPIPVYTGLLERVYQLSKYLGRDHDVSVIFPHEPDRKASEDGRKPDYRPFERVDMHSVAIDKLDPVIPSYSAVRGVYNMHPWLYPTVREQLVEQEPDVLIVEFPWLMPVGLAASRDIDCTVILSEHNVEYQFVKRMGNPLWRVLYRFEIAMCNRADVVVTVSETDREAIAAHVDGTTDVSTAPNGVDVERYEPSTGDMGQAVREKHDLTEPVVVYHGNLGNAQNSDAVERLLDTVFPEIRNEFDTASLLLVGADPPETDQPGVVRAGLVDDLPAYIGAADIAAVPLTIGSGTKLKILEYLASGIPLVTTPVGAEGLPLEHEKNALLVDEIDNMAKQAVRLVRDDTLYDQIERAERELAVSEFSWASTLSTYTQCLGSGT